MSKGKEQNLFEDAVRDKDISSITRLFRDVKQYRKSADFMKKLDFYSSFPYLGVYNAALVEQQRPGAKLVLTIEQWKKRNRKIKPFARPIIILLPFYPVEFLFDVADTKPINKTTKDRDNEHIEYLIYRHQAECSHDVSFYLYNLWRNLPKFGISYTKIVVGSTINSEIMNVTKEDREELTIEINKEHDITYHNYFIIGVDVNANGADELSLIIHELGHLFCQHIRCSWWNKRFFTKEVKEFEAEIVSYLVCQRLGIQTHSIEYLACYVNENEEIPPIDINCVFEAVDLIEKMVKENMDVTKCVMYKKDPEFKEKVDVVKAKIKEEKDAVRAAKQSL